MKASNLVIGKHYFFTRHRGEKFIAVYLGRCREGDHFGSQHDFGPVGKSSYHGSIHTDAQLAKISEIEESEELK